MLETAKLPKEDGKYGLLIPEKNLWLSDTAPLSRYADDIASAVNIWSHYFSLFTSVKESILLKEKESTWNPQQIALYAGLGSTYHLYSFLNKMASLYLQLI